LPTMSTPVEITWLLAAVAKGDAVAFERLYGATCAKLYGVVLRILRRHDLAADVMEEAYLQVWLEAGEFDPTRSTPLAWMVAIARRLAIDAARKPQPVARAEEHDLASEIRERGEMLGNQLVEAARRPIGENAVGKDHHAALDALAVDHDIAFAVTGEGVQRRPGFEMQLQRFARAVSVR